MLPDVYRTIVTATDTANTQAEMTLNCSSHKKDLNS